MGVWTLIFFAITVLEPRQPVVFGILFVLSGVAAAAPLSPTPALLADVSDYAAMKTGRREAGQYFAIWNVLQKAASAAGVGVALPLLGLLGFDPKNVTDAGLQALRIVCFIVPALPYLAAAILLWYLPLTDRRPAVIGKRLMQREI